LPDRLGLIALRSIFTYETELHSLILIYEGGFLKQGSSTNPVR